MKTSKTTANALTVATMGLTLSHMLMSTNTSPPSAAHKSGDGTSVGDGSSGAKSMVFYFSTCLTSSSDASLSPSVLGHKKSPSSLISSSLSVSLKSDASSIMSF